jgi:hypothetical protein
MRKEDDKKKNLSYLLHFFDSIHTHIFQTKKINQKEIFGSVIVIVLKYFKLVNILK